jgi:tetratricopeptide (TPR) repeat protein
MCPDAGHMNHMPGHIYVLCGQYDNAKIASVKAIRADRMYLEYAGPYNFYTTARCHDLHMMMYACMFLGQSRPAMEAAEEMCSTLSADVVDAQGRPQMSITLEGYRSTFIHVLVRFGKWQEIIDTPMPEPAGLYSVSTSMHHYARAIAHATLGNFAAAESERALFYSSRDQIAPNRKFFNNTARKILGVAEQMMEGELNYHLGDHDVAYGQLRESVARSDELAYSEPWAWMHPPRHALGALLLEQGYYEEAEDVYRTDLGLNEKLQRCAQHPGNIWSLHGLAECLRQRGESTELTEITEQLDAAIARADTPITSSCCCRKNVA